MIKIRRQFTYFHKSEWGNEVEVLLIYEPLNEDKKEEKERKTERLIKICDNAMKTELINQNYWVRFEVV